MLRQETIAQASLAVAMAGLLALWFLATMFEAKETKISEISEEMLEQKVKLNARVLSRKQNKETVFFELYDGTGTIKAVAFNASSPEMERLQKNSCAEFLGKVQTYKGELELVLQGAEQWH